MKKASFTRWSAVRSLSAAMVIHASTWLEDTPRPLERVTADGIEDDIHVPNLFFKPGGFIVNRLVRSEPLDEIDVLS